MQCRPRELFLDPDEFCVACNVSQRRPCHCLDQTQSLDDSLSRWRRAEPDDRLVFYSDHYLGLTCCSPEFDRSGSSHCGRGHGAWPQLDSERRHDVCCLGGGMRHSTSAPSQGLWPGSRHHDKLETSSVDGHLTGKRHRRKHGRRKKSPKKSLSSSSLPSCVRDAECRSEVKKSSKHHRKTSYIVSDITARKSGKYSSHGDLDLFDDLDLTPEEIDIDSLLQEQLDLDATLTGGYHGKSTLPGYGRHGYNAPNIRSTNQLDYGEDEGEFMVDRGICEAEIDRYFMAKKAAQMQESTLKSSFPVCDLDLHDNSSKRREFYCLPSGSKSLENGLDTIHELDAPELYGFEEYNPLYYLLRGDGGDPCIRQPYHDLNNAREFVRARTVAAIPVNHHLSQHEIKTCYHAPTISATFHPGPAVCAHNNATVPWALSNDGCHLLPGEIRPRSHSAECKHNQSGATWILGSEDDDSFSNGVSGLSPQGSCSSSNHASPTGTNQIFQITPPQVMASSPGAEERSQLDRSGSGRGSGLSRLARRLSQKERRTTEERRRALRQRSVSLDCGDGRHSINGCLLEPPDQNDKSLSIPASPSLPTKLSKNSSSPNLTGRLSRRSSGSKNRKSANETLDASMSRDKKKRSALDLLALFDAVEHQDMDRAKEILENNTINVNGLNEEELSPLDVAVMTNHIPMAKMLLSHGAKENMKFEKNYKLRITKVKKLIEDVEKRVNEMKYQITSMSANSSSYGGSQHKELKRQLGYWEFKHKLLKRMITGLENAKCPEEPTNVTLSVLSSSSLLVCYDEPISHNGAVVTGYKVEWSCYSDFCILAGEYVIDDPLCRSYCIKDLTHGTPYYVRIRAWNVKGYGEAATSNPPCAIPSSWREIDNSVPRSQGKLQLLNDLFVNMRNSRPADASEIKDSHTPASSPLHPRKSNMRKSIKNLFSSAPKFQKSFKRGVYLACVICHDDRILVTAEDTLPILEVDESFSTSTLNSDFHWLMKVACTWEDVKSLRQDMDKSSSSGSIQFRCKLLQVVGQLQSALGIQDLGRLYYQPYKDSSGSVVLVIVNSIKDPKCISTTHVKWMTYSKVQKKLSSSDGCGTPEMLLNSVPDMLKYQQSSSQALPRGLYLGYLKLKSSVDMIRIMVPEKTPNVLPYTQIRDLPNVTKEEWEWLRCLSRNEIRCPPTPAQIAFQNDVANSCKKLLQQLGISEDQAVSHRFYDVEVIEMSSDVSFLLLLPPVENVCSVPGHHEEITQLPNYTMLPVQVFEMIHMMMYQNEFISRYTRLSSILEMDLHLAQQAHREAFSSEELNTAKERLDQLAGFQQKLDEAWKGMRWTMDIITHARDKTVRGGLPLSVLYAPPPSPSDSPSVQRKEIGTLASSSNSDVASSTCSDCGYHSDISSADCHANRESCHCGAPGTDDVEVWRRPAPQPGILRVYAAYETGLARGTSVKLHVTPRTTSREVIDLVVQQLNKAVLCKGLDGPVYSDEELADFCLVAVIGARERVLRDDYQPLQLQNPWTSGQLYVRLKNNLLAAIEQGQVTTV